MRIEGQIFRVTTVVGESAGQSVVEGSVSLPVDAAEIGRLLSVKAQPEITRYEVVDDQVIFAGTLDYEVLYASITQVGAEEPDAEVVYEERLEKARWERAGDFELALDVAGAEPGLPAYVNAAVQSVSHELQDDNRSISIEAVVDLSASVHRLQEHALHTLATAKDDLHSEERQIRLPLPTVNIKGQEHLTGFLPFGGRVLPQKVLDLRISAVGEPIVNFLEGEVEVHAALTCEVLYTAAEVGAAQVEWPRELSLVAKMPWDEAIDPTLVSVNFSAADVTWQAVDTEDRRGLALEATIFVDVEVISRRNVAVLTDLTVEEPRQIAVRKDWLLLPDAVGEARQHNVTETTLSIPAEAFPIERVLVSEATVRLDDVHVLGDKVAVEGTASVDLLYVGRRDDTTNLATWAWPDSIPFEIEIPLVGAAPGLERRARVRVDELKIDLVNRETVAVELALETTVFISRSVEMEHVVEAVEIQAPHPDPPSYTFLVLQSGDTLWQIAQRYHTEVDAILQSNSWLENETAALTPGQKLCIPRQRPLPAEEG